jgi:hypothetical protein
MMHQTQAQAIILVGPIVSRKGGFAFDIFAPDHGIRPGFCYRTIDQAHYDRRATLSGSHVPDGKLVEACNSAPEFDQRCAAMLRGTRFDGMMQ